MVTTARKDGSPHVAPVWSFQLGDNNNTDIILATWHESLKAKYLIQE